MSESLLNQVRQIAADLFNVPVEQLTPESSPETVESWDSLQHLNLVLELEQRFRTTFAPEEIERMLTIESIARMVGNRRLPSRPQHTAAEISSGSDLA